MKHHNLKDESEKEHSTAELELKQQKYSNKSKNQDKTLGRRSARPKNSSKKQSISSSMANEKTHLPPGNGAAKFEGTN